MAAISVLDFSQFIENEISSMISSTFQYQRQRQYPTIKTYVLIVSTNFVATKDNNQFFRLFQCMENVVTENEFRKCESMISVTNK